MAKRAIKIGAVTAGGAVIAAALMVLCFGTLAAVIWRAEGVGLAPSDTAAIRFTVLQAATSALLSVVLAVPVARAMARRSFAGRSVLITLMGAPFLVPVIVAVLGLLEVFGRAGLFNMGLKAIGVPPFSIYGFHGVVLAHVFFNLPLAVRMILLGWQSIPTERFRLAASLGFAPRDVLRHLERPMLRDVLPGAAIVIFTLCLSSFAVALTLGGGPRATTIELGIYQALRFEFDLGRAAMLSAVQFGLCAIAVLISLRYATAAQFGTGANKSCVPWWGLGRGSAVQDALTIGLGAAFLILPLAMLALRGVPGLADLPAAIWPAMARSLAVAVVSSLLCMLASVLLTAAIVKGRLSGPLQFAAMVPLASSSLVLGTGLFLIVQPWIAAERLALPITALVNALLSLPFVIRVLLPNWHAIEDGYGRLATSLGLCGLSRWQVVIGPRLRRALCFAAGLTAALSIGDLGVVALFAGESGATLPLLVQRLSAAYRIDTAAGVALVLVCLSFGVFWLIDREGQRYAED